jgi:uncharacterized protein (DUF433 family)
VTPSAVSGGAPAPWLGRGIYDVGEIARLARRSPGDVVRWSRATQHDDALLLPTDGRLFGFHDLVTALVVGELRDHGADLAGIRRAHRYLRGRFQSQWPFAHEAVIPALAVAGRDVYVGEDDDWLDAGRGGQRPFAEVIGPLLERLQFGADQLAIAWRPADAVLVNPAVQAGAPCVQGTRITTRHLATLVLVGESPEDIAADYDLDLASVVDALAYEQSLAA